MDLKKLTHSQFIVYTEQIRAGKSHEQALEYCLKNELNVADFLFRNFRNRDQ